MTTVHMDSIPALPPARLDPNALYRAPSGRLCRLFALDARGGLDSAIAHLSYVRDASAGVSTRADDGFALQRENWRILEMVR